MLPVADDCLNETPPLEVVADCDKFCFDGFGGVGGGRRLWELWLFVFRPGEVRGLFSDKIGEFCTLRVSSEWRYSGWKVDFKVPFLDRLTSGSWVTFLFESETLELRLRHRFGEPSSFLADECRSVSCDPVFHFFTPSSDFWCDDNPSTS